MAVGCSVLADGAGGVTSGGGMISIENVSRRGFLKGVVGAGAFVIGVRLMPMDLLASGDVASLDRAAPMSKAPLHRAFMSRLIRTERRTLSRTGRRWGMACAPRCANCGG